MSCRTCDKEGYLVQTKLILKAVKGESCWQMTLSVSWTCNVRDLYSFLKECKTLGNNLSNTTMTFEEHGCQMT